MWKINLYPVNLSLLAHFRAMCFSRVDLPIPPGPAIITSEIIITVGTQSKFPLGNCTHFYIFYRSKCGHFELAKDVFLQNFGVEIHFFGAPQSPCKTHVRSVMLELFDLWTPMDHHTWVHFRPTTTGLVICWRSSA